MSQERRRKNMIQCKVASPKLLEQVKIPNSHRKYFSEVVETINLESFAMQINFFRKTRKLR